MAEPERSREAAAQPPPQRCDFCGREAEQVRRVALDAGYDRLLKPHAPRYACPSCSEAKERERRARA